jgi:poly(hydroxyalkanoate) depolymerase family esterase
LLRLEACLFKMATHGWITGRAHAAGGLRNYRLWVPAGLEEGKPSPLLMLLHGCKLSAESVAEISGMNEVAEANRFVVVYPEQPRRANLMKCWNWFNPKHQSRDAGEPSILAATVRQVCSRYNIAADRTYIAGISAGGAMAVIMAAAYPDLFAALAVCAGTEFKAATGASQGFAVMKHGGPDPAQQGRLAFEAMKPGLTLKTRRRMPVIVFHGSADPCVNPVNADQIVHQWSTTNACLAAANVETEFALSEKTESGQVPDGYSYQRYIYTDQVGALLMEKWIVQGLGHSWSGSPHAHRYGDPKGPRASAEIWRFCNESATKPSNGASPAPSPRATLNETTP